MLQLSQHLLVPSPTIPSFQPPHPHLQQSPPVPTAQQALLRIQKTADSAAMSAFPESVRTEFVVVPNVQAKPAGTSRIATAIPPVSASRLLGMVPATGFVARMLYAVGLLHAPMTLTAQGEIARETNVRLSLVVAHHLWLSQGYVLRACVRTLLRI